MDAQGNGSIPTWLTAYKFEYMLGLAEAGERVFQRIGGQYKMAGQMQLQTQGTERWRGVSG